MSYRFAERVDIILCAHGSHHVRALEQNRGLAGGLALLRCLEARAPPVKVPALVNRNYNRIMCVIKWYMR